jgi:hypothetical protein
MSKGNHSRRVANGRKSPVARVLNLVNRPQTHRDRKNEYRRERLNVRDFVKYV